MTTIFVNIGFEITVFDIITCMSDNPASIAECLAESQKQERAGNLSEAIVLARQALVLSSESGDNESAGQALVACAQAYFRLGNYSECENLVHQALERVGEESQVRVDGLRILGVSALETNRMNEGEDYLRTSIALSRQLGSDHQLARSLHNLSAGVYMPRGQFDLSLQADQEALRICRRHDYTELYWGPLLTQAWVRWLDSQPEACRELLKELEQVVLPGSLGDGYVHLLHAQLSMDCGDSVAAELELVNLFSLSERLGIPELRIFSRLARSRFLRLAKQIPSAITWAEDARKIAADIGYRHLEGLAFIEIGRLAKKNGGYQKAESAFRDALRILDSMALRYDAARAALLLAALLHDQQDSSAQLAWIDASSRILEGGFISLLKSEAEDAGHLMAAYEQPGGILSERYQLLPPPPLRVVTFGGLRIWVGEREVDYRELRKRRGADLLVLLLLQPRRSLPVEQAADMLSPRASPSAAQTGFYQASSVLRRVLEPDLPEKFPSRYLKVDNGFVSLHLPEGSSVDFERLNEYSRTQQWQAVLELADGVFLPENLYTEWTTLYRQRFMDTIEVALFERAHECLQSEQYLNALEYCRRLIALEPWHEQAVMLGMQACLGLGNRSAARRIYQNLTKTLQRDLSSVPSEEIQAYYQSLDQRRKK